MTPEGIGWERRAIQELVDDSVLAINDGYRARNAELGDEGLPFARAANVNNGFDLKEADRLVWERVQRAGQKRSRSGDVVFTSKGTVGRFAFVQDSTPEFVYSPQLCFWRVLDSTAIEPRFLHYWMHGRECERQFHAAKGSTDMADYISLRDQRSMSITLPRLDEQRRIARVLGSLDDKIESNRRVAATLEEIAAALFRARFVDFVDRDDLVESEIGPVPRAWEIGAIEDLCADARNGGTPRRMEPEYWNGGTISWFTTGQLRDGFLPAVSEERITERGLAESACRLYPPRTVLVAIYAAPTVGRLGILDTEGACNQACTALHARDDVGYPFLYFTLRALKTYFNSLSSGSAQQNISKKLVVEAKVALPPTEEVEAFTRAAEPLLETSRVAGREDATLSALRDTLLPKLISGQIRVPEDAFDDAEVT